MRRVLQRIQTAAADRSRFVPHPRLHRQPASERRDWTVPAARAMLLGWLMLVVWGWWLTLPLALVVLLLGTWPI